MENIFNSLDEVTQKELTGTVLNFYYLNSKLKELSSSKDGEISVKELKKINSEFEKSLSKIFEILGIDLDKNLIGGFIKLKESGISKEAIELARFL